VAWADHAIRTLRDAEKAAKTAGIAGRLHLWLDFDALGNWRVVEAQEDSDAYVDWLTDWLTRISEWPEK
jgi:hypothetical protein